MAIEQKLSGSVRAEFVAAGGDQGGQPVGGFVAESDGGDSVCPWFGGGGDAGEAAIDGSLAGVGSQMPS
ncbi:hypothetical protein [Nocardia sp. NPDC004711]